MLLFGDRLKWAPATLALVTVAACGGTTFVGIDRDSGTGSSGSSSGAGSSGGSSSGGSSGSSSGASGSSGTSSSSGSSGAPSSGSSGASGSGSGSGSSSSGGSSSSSSGTGSSSSSGGSSSGSSGGSSSSSSGGAPGCTLGPILTAISDTNQANYAPTGTTCPTDPMPSLSVCMALCPATYMGLANSGCDTFTMDPYCSNTPCLGCFYQ